LPGEKEPTTDGQPNDLITGIPFRAKASAGIWTDTAISSSLSRTHLRHIAIGCGGAIKGKKQKKGQKTGLPLLGIV